MRLQKIENLKNGTIFCFPHDPLMYMKVETPAHRIGVVTLALGRYFPIENANDRLVYVQATNLDSLYFDDEEDD